MDTQRAIEAHRFVADSRRADAGLAIAVGQALREIQNENLFLAVVGEGGSWDDYLKQPDVDLSRDHATRLMRASLIVEQLELDPQDLTGLSSRRLIRDIASAIPFRKGATLAPEVKADILELIEAGRSDLRYGDFLAKVESFKLRHPKATRKGRKPGEKRILEGTPVLDVPTGSAIASVVKVSVSEDFHYVTLKWGTDRINGVNIVSIAGT